VGPGDAAPARLAARGLAGYPGAEIAVREFENGPPIDAPVAMRIEGLARLVAGIATRVEQILKTTPGTEYVTNPFAPHAPTAR
jgi:hypothetical protein